MDLSYFIERELEQDLADESHHYCRNCGRGLWPDEGDLCDICQYGIDCGDGDGEDEEEYEEEYVGPAD